MHHTVHTSTKNTFKLVDVPYLKPDIYTCTILEANFTLCSILQCHYLLLSTPDSHKFCLIHSNKTYVQPFPFSGKLYTMARIVILSTE